MTIDRMIPRENLYAVLQAAREVNATRAAVEDREEAIREAPEVREDDHDELENELQAHDQALEQLDYELTQADAAGNDAEAKRRAYMADLDAERRAKGAV